MNYPNRIIKVKEADKYIVEAIQAQLKEKGVQHLTIDGIFGPKTTAALKEFQATHRDNNGNLLEIDGQVGPITWEVLFDIPASAFAEAPNSLLNKVLEVARSHIGVIEEPPGSNRGPQIDAYLASVNCPPGSFWCAAFTYFCFDEAADILGRNNPAVKTGGCLKHWNKTTGKKISTSNALMNFELIKPGQVFIMNHGQGLGHTGIIEKIKGGYIDTIEGNSNPNGSRNGIGVFRITRKISKINQGFIEYS